MRKCGEGGRRTHEFAFNPGDIILDKLQVDDEKYSAEMVKGKSDKYTAYDKKRRNTEDRRI